VKVVSKLVELDFEISKIEAAKNNNGIVILNDPEKSIPTKVHVTPEDAMAIAKVVLKSGVAWRFAFTFPYLYWKRKNKKSAKDQKKLPGR
jgi:hypothetical protein